MKIDDDFLIVVNKHLQIIMTEENLNDELRKLGLTSMGSIELLLDLEDYYNVLFPDELLTQETFSTGKTLWTTISLLKENKG